VACTVFEEKIMYNVTCDDVVLASYTGFSVHKGKTGRIAIAIFDGETDLYDVDDGANLSTVDHEIRRKYRDDYSREPERIMFYGLIPCIKRG
jgi:hypothetical protein